MSVDTRKLTCNQAFTKVRAVCSPSAALKACYGLTPPTLSDGVVRWEFYRGTWVLELRELASTHRACCLEAVRLPGEHVVAQPFPSILRAPTNVQCLVQSSSVKTRIAHELSNCKKARTF